MNEPVLRFIDSNERDYPGWSEYGLFDIGKTNSNEKLPRQYTGDSEIPFYKVSDMNMPGNEKIMQTSKTYLKKALLSEKNVKIYYQDAIIFAKRGAALFLDRKRIASKPFALDSNMMGFFPKTCINLNYLYYWFCTKRLSDYAQDGALPALNSYNIESMNILLPSQNEQQKIAYFLSTVDEKIALKQKKYDALVEAKKGLLQKIFSQEIRFKRDDGGEYPEWKEISLGSFATRIKRKNTDNESDLPLTISSIDGLVDQRDYFDKIIASVNMSGYYLLKRGEFAYNKSYSKGFPVGSVKRLEKYDKGALSTLYICFSVDEMQFNPEFIAYYFDSTFWHEQVMERCAEGARNHGLLNIGVNDFFDTKHTLPPDIDEQKKIANFLSAFDEKIEAVRKELEGWKTVKKGLLQQMFC